MTLSTPGLVYTFLHFNFLQFLRQSRSVPHGKFCVFNITILNEMSSEALKPLKMPTNGYWKHCKMLAYSQALCHHCPRVKKCIQSGEIQKILRWRKNFILNISFCDDGVSHLEAVWGQIRVHMRSDEALNFRSHL